jgi:hypothetical protein
MNGKTRRSEECTYDNGGRVDGVVLDDVVVGGSEDVTSRRRRLNHSQIHPLPQMLASFVANWCG